MHQLWIERGGKDMTKQRLKTQLQSTENWKLLSGVEIGEIVGADRTEDDVEALNEKSDKLMVI